MVSGISNPVRTPVLLSWNTLWRVIEASTDAGAAIASASCLALSLLVFVNVLLRYLFNAPWIHTDEILRYLTAWTVFWGLAYCGKLRGHIRVDLWISRFHGQTRRLLELTADAMSTLWVCGLTYGAWLVWWNLWLTKQTAFGVLDIQEWIPGVGLIVGMGLFALRGVLELLKSAIPARPRSGEEFVSPA